MSNELEPEDRALIQKMRALPREGNEPDWNEMARAIHRAVEHAPKRRRWHWWFALVPIAAAAAAMLLWMRSSREVPFEIHVPVPQVQTAELWLDGEPLDVDAVDPGALPEAPPAPDEIANGDDLLGAPVFGAVDQLDDNELERAERWLDRKKS